MGTYQNQTASMLIHECEDEAEKLTAEILNDLSFLDDEEEKIGDLCLISVKRQFNDTTEEAMDIEKIARLRKLIANGKYHVKPQEVARALLLSGDL